MLNNIHRHPTSQDGGWSTLAPEVSHSHLLSIQAVKLTN